MRRTAAAAIIAALYLSWTSPAVAQARAFDAGDPSTYPAGTTGCTEACTSGTITLPLPPDGVLTFSRFVANGAFTILFATNAANTPVTIRVSGDVILHAPSCCGSLSVSGHDATAGTANAGGHGGNGGPGGYTGGYGHAQPITGFTIGGNGLGPGGGIGATTTLQAVGGEFVGGAGLNPIVGGSGGGGGTGGEDTSGCTGGGGGGGGGGLLIIATGKISLQNFGVHADGGMGGDVGDRTCAQGGAGGSGGGIRLVARTFEDLGGVKLTAHGGNAGFKSLAGTAGRVRLESSDATALHAFASEPEASRVQK